MQHRQSFSVPRFIPVSSMSNFTFKAALLEYRRIPNCIYWVLYPWLLLGRCHKLAMENMPAGPKKRREGNLWHHVAASPVLLQLLNRRSAARKSNPVTMLRYGRVRSVGINTADEKCYGIWDQ